METKFIVFGSHLSKVKTKIEDEREVELDAIGNNFIISNSKMEFLFESEDIAIVNISEFKKKNKDRIMFEIKKVYL